VKAINAPIKIRNNAPIILNKINPSDALNYKKITLKLLNWPKITTISSHCAFNKKLFFSN